jgi:hypothetical protein
VLKPSSNVRLEPKLVMNYERVATVALEVLRLEMRLGRGDPDQNTVTTLHT